MSQEFVAVLDLGTTKAVCLAASSEGDQVKVRAVATTPCKALRKGVLTDAADAARSIEVVVRRVEQDLGHSVDALVVGISGAHIEGLNAQGLRMIVPRSRSITHQDVMEVINHSRSVMLPSEREQIQILPREFRVDGQANVRHPIGMNGSKLEVFAIIVTGVKEAISQLEKAVTSTGRKVDQIILSSLASGLGVLSADEMEKGTAVVDIGGSETNIAIFANGSLASTASIPVGGEHVSNDLSKLLKTTFEEAERLKLTHGTALASNVSEAETIEVMQLDQAHARPMQRRVLCEIIDSRMREIANLVRDHLVKAGFEASLHGGVVLTGGGTQLENVDRLFFETLKDVPVRLAEPDLGGKFPRQPGMATAAGLARFALQCNDEVSPAAGGVAWRDRVRGFFSIVSNR